MRISSRLSAALIAALVLLPARASTAQAAPRPRQAYWRAFAAGFATSLLVHESAHVATALAVGGHPHFGFDTGRPTIYSGLDARLQPRKQFEFSSAGLVAQSALDEAILDVPHHRGSAFERGVLAGGIGTALFYATIGRSGSVSDVDYMARTSSLTKTDLTILVGGVAVLHALRLEHDGHYADFFLRPAPQGGLRVGMRTQ